MPYYYIPSQDEPSDSEADDNGFTYEEAEAVPLLPEKLDVLASFVFTALKNLGAKSIRVRYDGGCDEGFSDADSVTMADGVRTPKEIAAILAETAPIADLRAQITDKRYDYERKLSDTELMECGLEYLADSVATALLGGGFGTGEGSIYGACVLDLESCKITDDPTAKVTD